LDPFLAENPKILHKVEQQKQNGLKVTLTKAEVRKLMTSLKDNHLNVYKKVKSLSFKDQRKLFVQDILNSLGLGALGNSLGKLGSSALGVGAVAAGVGVGAIAGRVAQNNMLAELKKQKFKIDGDMIMMRNQRDNERAKLDYKVGELENQLGELSDSSETGVNLLNLWVDGHSLI